MYLLKMQVPKAPMLRELRILFWIKNKSSITTRRTYLHSTETLAIFLISRLDLGCVGFAPSGRSDNSHIGFHRNYLLEVGN